MALESALIQRIATALVETQERTYTGTDIAWATRHKINASTYSQIKTAVLQQKWDQLDRKLRDQAWITLAITLGVQTGDNAWNTVTNTHVYQAIKSDIDFCKKYSKSMMFVDECEIGKSHSARHVANNMQNCFYVDCSLAKSKKDFVKALARAVGVDATGTLTEITASIIFQLKGSKKPVVILDEAGDLDKKAFLELKAFWNATDRCCGWYMIGADGLAAKIERGMQRREVGYREVFSRFGSKFTSVVPKDKQQALQFKKDLLTKVVSANIKNKNQIGEIVKACLVSGNDNHNGGLRRAEGLIMLKEEAA